MNKIISCKSIGAVTTCNCNYFINTIIGTLPLFTYLSHKNLHNVFSALPRILLGKYD